MAIELTTILFVHQTHMEKNLSIVKQLQLAEDLDRIQVALALDLTKLSITGEQREGGLITEE